MWSFDFNEQELINFIREALNNCYLGDMKKSETTERPGAFEMEYAKGDFNYRDSFLGFYTSSGQEIVRYKGKIVWSSNYSGGLIDEYIGDLEFFKTLEIFLRKALKITDSDNFSPRGPRNFIEGDFEYVCEWSGDISKFSGIEHIKYKGREVFYHNFFGNVIVGYDFNSSK